MEWEGKRLTGGEAWAVYKNALDSVNYEAGEKGIPVQKEQYAVMKYLQKHLKGLKFREL
jgi:hypothetical protein